MFSFSHCCCHVGDIVNRYFHRVVSIWYLRIICMSLRIFMMSQVAYTVVCYRCVFLSVVMLQLMYWTSIYTILFKTEVWYCHHLIKGSLDLIFVRNIAHNIFFLTNLTTTINVRSCMTKRKFLATWFCVLWLDHATKGLKNVIKCDCIVIAGILYYDI